MSFTIVRTNGTVLTVIPDGDLNTTSTPLFLPGRNYPGYGSVIDTNFVRQLENFAFGVVPQNALQGQLWFDTNTQTLKICPTDGESNASNWYTVVSSNNTGNVEADSLNANAVVANSGAFVDTVTANLFDSDYLNINVQANITDIDVSGTATIATISTNNITTGSNTTAGTLTGAWSLDGTLNSNGNITAAGFKSDNYYYANGQSINFDAAAGNSGEVQFNTAGSLASSVNFGFNTSNNYLFVNGNLGVGNVTLTGVITGNAAGLSSIPSANLSGALPSAIQSNITQVGTLSGLTVTGNINTANVFTSNLVATSFYVRSIATGISAAGTNQATATALTKEINVVTTVSSGQGVVLPTATAGMMLIINNRSATALNVYPASGGSINDLSTNIAYSHDAGASLQYYATSSSQWYTVGASYA